MSALSSATGSRLNAPEREGQAECLAWPAGTALARRSWERIGGWAVKNGGSNRISEVRDCHVGVLSLYGCDPLRQVAPEWLLGRKRRVRAGSRRIRRSGTELDFMGNDRKGAPRWPGIPRSYGRVADGTRFSRRGEWGIRRSAAISMGGNERSVKPSAQPTLVRTQHLPLPAETARCLRVRAGAGRCATA